MIGSGEVELVVDFVMTLVGMGKLNGTSFGLDSVGLRGSSSSFVSIGLRIAFGPCCDALKLVASDVVLLIGFEPEIGFVEFCF